MVSIIVVTYKVKKQLLECLNSIYKSKPKTEFEIIVVNNGDEDRLEETLGKNFPKVIYVKSDNNLGYGGGINLGAKYARGEYLFILNPDTLVLKNTVDELVNFFTKNKKVGIISPLLLDKEGRPFNLQGTGELTPLKAVVCRSFLEKLFPNNRLSREYWLKDWNHSTLKEVDVCPGAALMIPREVFNRVGGFDENFFLYFEEDDISKRVKALGYKIYILSKAKVFHEVAASTKQTNNADKIFVKSRFKYLRKHFGMLNAIPVELFLRINKMTVLLFLLTCVALFLRIYNLSRGMSFIGDQGWFYLSARDMLIYGKIPLVGITSSHTWLHQGPLWTYMLSIVLLLSKFNPVSGAYLTVGLGIITTWLMYRVGNEMFSQKVGIIAALLYMCSPLVVVFDRMPFDPSPIPLFTILYLFTLYKWIKGNVNFFPIILLLLAILYNLELATFALVFPFALIFAYGYLKKKSWVRGLLNRKIVFYSLILPIITMLPVIIYDFSHGFKQTIVFVGWTIYKPLSALLVHQASSSHLSISIFLNFLSSSLARLLFQPNQLVAIVLLILSILYLGYIFVSKRSVSKGLLIFTLLVSLLGIIVNQTPSDAYLPIAIPFVILTVAILLAYTSEIRYIKYFSFLLLTLIVLGNSYAVFRNDLTNDFGSRLDATGKIIKLTNNQEYDLIGKGPGSQFSSFTMNYTYLLWWEGHPASNKDVQTKIVVWESPKGIIIYRK